MPSVYFVFKKSIESSAETLVNWWAGPMVHVDVVFGDSRLMFTSFMFEHFSMNRPDGYKPTTHHCMAMQITQKEHDDSQALMLRFVGKRVPYNYADVFRFVMPGPCNPVDLESEDQVETLFCSQAVTLMLKWGMPERAEFAALNSRCTTPTMLYEALKSHCTEAEAFLAP